MNETTQHETTTTKTSADPLIHRPAPKGAESFATLGYSDEEIAQIQRELQTAAGTILNETAQPAQTEATSTEAKNAEASEQTPPYRSAPAAWEPKPDPYATPEYMTSIRPLFYLWTIEAIESGAYDHEVEQGKFKKLYRPIDGLTMGRVGKPGDGAPPCVAMWLYEETLGSDRSGKVRKVKKGQRLHVTCNEHLRELLPLLDEDGAAHVRIRPLGWETLSDGTKEMTYEVTVEPDPVDPTRIKLIPLSTVLGEGR